MKYFTLYIFDRQGTCLLYQEAHRTKPVKQGAGTPSDDQKMLFGLFFSLKTFTAAMDPKGCAGPSLHAHAAACLLAGCAGTHCKLPAYKPAHAATRLLAGWACVVHAITRCHTPACRLFMRSACRHTLQRTCLQAVLMCSVCRHTLQHTCLQAVHAQCRPALAATHLYLQAVHMCSACREKAAQLGAPLRIGEACSFHTFRCNNYKLHFHESLSGIKVSTEPMQLIMKSLLGLSTGQQWMNVDRCCVFGCCCSVLCYAAVLCSAVLCCGVGCVLDAATATAVAGSAGCAPSCTCQGWPS